MFRFLFIIFFSFSSAFADNNNTESYVISSEPTIDKHTSIEIQKIAGKENIKVLNSSTKIVELSEEKKEKIDELISARPEYNIEVNKLQNDYRELTSRAPLISQESQEKQEILDTIQNAKTTEKVELINVAPPTILNHAIKSGYDKRDGFDKPASFTITIEGVKVSVTRKSIETAENGYIWKGDIEDGNGSALIISDNNKLSGTIHYKENVYSLVPLNDSTLHALIKKNFKDIKEEPTNHESTRDSTAISKTEESKETDEKINTDGENIDNNDYTEITVVVAYTKQAEANSPN
ncbi:MULTISPECIES: hypothetical protein [Methylomonas]|uniref:Uncharacterized protein n=2 Tax=Methylomonas TaxID=416 RepID=A0A140E5Z4_9GAMM|nr:MULTISPECIES: hypothetical protein [Methylomonas]AMK78818.1 hypothetical protein JT25_020385 [Methylomonas denitrificans]OAH97033.1 hypothetical protein A1342_07210 [Methylomonas methanica]TCV75167.1 hypothetical protein EDE11_1371 [Methylomonas methanica]